jgi:uncharacterized membrane protein
MNNNYHLLLVHFPIALLSLYTFLEILSVSKYFYKKESLEITKGILVVTGVVSAMFSRVTGEMVEDIINRNNAHMRATLNLHELFSGIVVAIFVILAISYLISFFENTPEIRNSKFYNRIRSIIPAWVLTFIFFFESRFIRIILAVLGGIAVMLTGALGGILSNSCSIDPVTVLVCKAFGL